MAADLDLLVPELKTKTLELLERCRQRGYVMRANYGLRHPLEQAKLWRQSRSREEILAKIAEFRAAGADFLAFCLESVGPQHGDPVTNVPPGYSWHQWGEAVDAFWLLDSKAEWSTTKKVNGENAYHVFADEAEALGLTAGGHWKKFKDWPHVQLRATSNPGALFTAVEIDREMKKRFGG